MSSNDPVEKAFIFTSRSADKIGNAIAWFSAPKSWWLQIHNVPSHTGLMFVRNSGESEYFESHSPEGWRGPKPKSRLEDWAGDHEKRWFKMRPLDVSIEEAQALYQSCSDRLTDPDWIDYPEHQIWEMAKAKLFKGDIKRSKGVICSEAVAKILYPYFDLRLWSGKRPITFDEITPWRCQVIPLVRRGSEIV